MMQSALTGCSKVLMHEWARIEYMSQADPLTLVLVLSRCLIAAVG